jgi:hypothetical protein
MPCRPTLRDADAELDAAKTRTEVKFQRAQGQAETTGDRAGKSGRSDVLAVVSEDVGSSGLKPGRWWVPTITNCRSRPG